MKKSYKIVLDLQSEVNAAIELIDPTYKGKGYMVNQYRGRYKGYKGYFTVPLWAYKEGVDYFLYYVAHELSHYYDTLGHTIKFYKRFKRICPEWCQHFEYGYKPKKAEMYGVKK